LQQIAKEDSAAGIEQVGGELLRHIEEVRNEKKKDLQSKLIQALEERDKAAKEQEMAIKERDEARKERDRAVTKLVRVSSETDTLKLQLRLLEAENKRLDRERVALLQAERDALKLELNQKENELHSVKSELDGLQMIYSLHKSLSQEKVLKSHFATTLDDFEDVLKKREHELRLAQRENFKLARQIMTIDKERDDLYIRVCELEKNLNSPVPQTNRSINSRLSAQSPTFQGSVV
jgi:chromosome segregation ATPase